MRFRVDGVRFKVDGGLKVKYLGSKSRVKVRSRGGGSRFEGGLLMVEDRGSKIEGEG